MFEVLLAGEKKKKYPQTGSYSGNVRQGSSLAADNLREAERLIAKFLLSLIRAGSWPHVACS